MKQREAERQQPRRHAGGQDRQEIPGGMRAAMHLGGEALEMLLDEEEAQELVVGERNRDEPGCGDREKQRASGENLHFSKQCPVALDQDIESERRQRQHDADQSLAQHGEGACRPGEEHVPEHEREHGAAEEERQPHVQRIDLPEHDVERAAGKDRGRIQSRRRAEQAVAGGKHQEKSGEPGERRPQPGGPILDFKYLEERGGGPVLQRWLLEVLEAVQARRDPVAARQYLARDLGVAALVGLVKRPHAERAEPRDREQRKHEPHAALRHANSSAAATLRSSATRMLKVRQAALRSIASTPMPAAASGAVSRGCGKRWRGPVPSRTISTPRFASLSKSSLFKRSKTSASHAST